MTSTLYNRVALLRTARGASRRELAEFVGVNPQTIGFIERGDYAPSLELGLRIAAYFDVPVELVFSLTPFEPLGEALRRAGDAAR
jgi:DNA-binding XRE family transcriptional regulator